jgi:hypothetical protein
MRIYPRQSLLTRLHARYLVFCVNSIGQSDTTMEEEEEAEPRNLKTHSSVALTESLTAGAFCGEAEKTISVIMSGAL